MSGGYRGRGLTQTEVDAITADFKAAGGVLDQSADAQRYLQARGAGGLTLNQGHDPPASEPDPDCCV